VTAAISLAKAIVPAVPNDAIVTVDGQDYIFMLADNEVKHKDNRKESVKHDGKEQKGYEENELTFQRAAIAKGTSDVGYTEITLLKEIPKGAKIVTKGAFFVSAKMTNIEEE